MPTTITTSHYVDKYLHTPIYTVPDKPGEAENGSVPNMSQDEDSLLSDGSFGS